VLNGALAVAIALAVQAAPQPVVTAAQAWPDDRPLTHFFQNLGHDLAGLPSRESAGTLALGGVGAIIAHRADAKVTNWVRNSGSASYTDLGNGLGAAWIEGAGALATYTVGKLKDSDKVAHVGGDLIRAQALNGVLTIGVKVAVNRTRPGGGHHSLPSGHSSATFASAAVLQSHFGWKAGVPAYGTAAFVAWSRIRDQSHWLSDVILGATIGTIAGQTIARGHRAGAWRVTPVVSRTAMAVYVTK
jgi:PAP2 superfamily protein